MSVPTLDRPAFCAELREVPAPTRVPRVPAPTPVPRAWAAAVAGVVLVATLVHWLQSRGHLTPAIFTDELLFSELARSFAEGGGVRVRDEPFSFPAVIPALLQAPAWLVSSTPVAYELAKALSTAVMCLAAVPAYWLSRRLVRPAYALLVAVATVAGGPMLYHGYLTSEAAAYPVFLLGVGVCVRALEAPSPRRDLLAVAVLGFAVLTRAQFLVLPLMFVLAVFLVGRPVRRHATALALLVGAALAFVVVGTSALGYYSGAHELEYSLAETIRWGGWTTALLPFTAGLLVVPGAIVGLGFALIRPRSAAERPFAAVTALLIVLLPVQAGLVASGDAGRPFERYVFYVLPLVFLAFCSLAERNAVRARFHLAAALGLGAVAVAIPFSTLALDRFAFDSPTLSAVEAAGRWATPGDAAVLFAAAGVAAALAAVLLRRRPALVVGLSIGLSFLVGIAAYSGDRRMTEETLASLAAAEPDWLERTGIREADVLALPGGSLHSGWILESWNRNVGRTFHLGDVPNDPLPFTNTGLRPDGSLAAAGAAVHSEYLVVDSAGTRVELEARAIARPRPNLTLYRTAGPVRFRSVAFGVHHDGWADSIVRYAAFPRETWGAYRVVLSLPSGRLARQVRLEAGHLKRRIELAPGTSKTVTLPVSGHPLPQLTITVDRADFVGAETTRPRLVAARVMALEFIPGAGSRNQ
ncbi:MAG: ArnT family glycosyltransferase [Gaiellaceae bacterium]